jgi:hypothetical protein
LVLSFSGEGIGGRTNTGCGSHSRHETAARQYGVSAGRELAQLGIAAMTSAATVQMLVFAAQEKGHDRLPSL